MNFAQMLMTPVQPLFSEDELPSKRSGNPSPDAERGWRARMAKAEEHYREVMGTKWCRTRDIEKMLGQTPSTARGFLMARMTEGRMERRKYGPEDSWNFGVGYEWRWVK